MVNECRLKFTCEVAPEGSDSTFIEYSCKLVVFVEICDVNK